MFDIHTHILPGLDDGPGTLDEAVDMVRMAAAAGTTDLVATPHYNPEFELDPAAVRRKLAQLRASVGPSPALHAGCELHLTADSVEAVLAAPTNYTIGGTVFLLTEFSSFLTSRAAGRILRTLLDSGLVPVIAHPERNPYFQRGADALSEWCGMGCLVQVTANSFLGTFGNTARRTAHQLLRSGLVHVVASDGHDTVRRPPCLDSTRRAIESSYGSATADVLLVSNPRAIVAGSIDEIATVQPVPRNIFTRLRSAFTNSEK